MRVSFILREYPAHRDWRRARIGGALPAFNRSPELSQDLPIVVEIVDAPEKIEAFMSDLEAMVGDGLITLERAQVLLYRPGR
jgi:hypothetical protein